MFETLFSILPANKGKSGEVDTSLRYRPDSKNILWCENNIQQQKEEETENWKNDI